MCPVCNFRLWLQSYLKGNRLVGVKAMTYKKERERVIAEITVSHLIRLGSEQGSLVSRQQALAFLNQEGRAFEMWKHMMQAAEEFIAVSLLRNCFSTKEHSEFVSGSHLAVPSAPPRG